MTSIPLRVAATGLGLGVNVVPTSGEAEGDGDSLGDGEGDGDGGVASRVKVAQGLGCRLADGPGELAATRRSEMGRNKRTPRRRMKPGNDSTAGFVTRAARESTMPKWVRGTAISGPGRHAAAASRRAPRRGSAVLPSLAPGGRAPTRPARAPRRRTDLAGAGRPRNPRSRSAACRRH